MPGVGQTDEGKSGLLFGKKRKKKKKKG